MSFLYESSTDLNAYSILHHATALELKLRQTQEWAEKLDVLDTDMMNGDLAPEFDDDLELRVSDGKAVAVANSIPRLSH